MSKLPVAVLVLLVFCSLILTTPPVNAVDTPLGVIKTLEDGTSVSVSGPIVTAISPLVSDGFYVESANRSAGIKIVSATVVQVGDSLSIAGIVGTQGREKVIEAASVSILSSGNPVPTIIGMNCKDILKKPDSIGKNIKTWGTISDVDTAAPPQWFTIKDASNRAVKCKLGSSVIFDSNWSIVAVTGVASVEDAAGQELPVLLISHEEGVQPLTGGGISGKVAQSRNQVINQVVESLHPYLANTNEIWTITGPSETMRIRCHFIKVELETGYDYLRIKDKSGSTVQSYSNTNAFFDVWSSWVPGDTLMLHLTSDSGVQRYGFQVDKYEVDLLGTPIQGVILTLEPGGITTLTGADGAYSFGNLSDGAYTITPSLPGAAFTPPSRTVTVAGGFLQNVNFVKM